MGENRRLILSFIKMFIIELIVISIDFQWYKLASATACIMLLFEFSDYVNELFKDYNKDNKNK